MTIRPSSLIIALLATSACGARPETSEAIAPLPGDTPAAPAVLDEEYTLSELVLEAGETSKSVSENVNGDSRSAEVQEQTLRQRASLDACSPAAPAPAPTLAGSVHLSFEISERGEVIGAATDPAGGQDGIAAVASCLIRQVRQLRFPARPTAGVTRVHLPVVVRSGQERS